MEEWRSFLYPLGFLSTVAFGIRFIVQWIQSEISQKSVVTPLFWYMSILGNLLLIIHSFVQIQFHIYLIQCWNLVISWRNLNLMSPPERHVSLQTVFKMLVTLSFIAAASFILQDRIFGSQGHWFRIPQAPWQIAPIKQLPLFIHILGTLAYIIFSARFWVQWWLTEKAQKSILPASFWMISLVGALLSIFYFFEIGDSVNLIGPSLGLIPYFRNLMLLKQDKGLAES